MAKRPKIEDIVASELAQIQVMGDVGVAQPDPSNDMRVAPAPLCEVCGRYHGGVNAMIACALGRVRQLTARVAELEAELAARPPFFEGLDEKGRQTMQAAGYRSIQDLRAAVAKLPSSAHEKNMAGKRPGGE